MSQLINPRCSPNSRRRRARLCFEHLENRQLLAGDLAITEFVARNQLGIEDEDGDRSDWIEIHNSGSESINLGGYYLSDDPEDLTKWRFPERTLAAKAYEVVYASGKNRSSATEPLHTSFRLSAGGESLLLVEPDRVTIADSFVNFPAQYDDVSFGSPQPIEFTNVVGRETAVKYLIPGFDNPAEGTDWRTLEFDDGEWGDGLGGVGYDHTNRVTELIDTDIEDEMRGINTSLFVRYDFVMEDVSTIQGLELQMLYDDGFIAYLNGVEVARNNAPEELFFDARATGSRSTDEKTSVETFDITPFLSQLSVGENVLAIRGLNRSIRSSFFVTPALVAKQPGDIAGDQSRFFKTPTPGEANGDISYGGVLDSVDISLKHGFYDTPQSTTITSRELGVSIAYTLDGSVPTADNGMIVAPDDPSVAATTTIAIDRTSILRAAAIREDYLSVQPETSSYVFVDDVITQSADGSAPEGWPTRRINGQIFTYGMDPDVVEDPQFAPLIRDALLDISSISIVTDQKHLFDPDTGFYVNGRRAGDENPADWERPTSVELIHPDGTPGFQIDAGIRMRGGASRSPENPKHALRLFFRGEYGETKLRYPMFGDEGVAEFDGIDLRTPSLIAWHWCLPGSARFRCENNTFLRDIFARDTQRDMGHAYTRSRYHHVYLNGQYWGLYQSQERPEASFAESYFGGDKEDYDVIKVERAEPERVIYATDGSLDAWAQLWNQAVAGFETDEAYYRAQGLNPDGTRNTDYPVYLNVENLIDYMIIQFWGGNLDGPISDNIGNMQTNNWITIRDRNGDDGFLFFAHDSEYIMLNVEQNRVGHWPVGDDFENSNPQWLHQQLTQNGRYREAFADRVYKHLFNNGALTAEASLARVQDRADEIDVAIIAESARWGDSNRNAPYTRDDWLDAVSHIVDTYIPQRTEIFLDQLRNAPINQFSDLPAPLFPQVDAPRFSQHGGEIDPGFQLQISANEPVYYTLDGSDPKAASPEIDFDLMVEEGGGLRYLVPTDDSLGADWTLAEFDDAAWSEATSALGFEQDGDALAGAIATNVGESMLDISSSVYTRTRFAVADPDAYDVLELSMQYDDGFVAYLNGTEVARSNVRGEPSWDSEASRRRTSSADLRVFETVDLSHHLNLLRVGDNVLSVHGLNRGADDDDFFLLPELRAGRLLANGASSSAQLYTGPITLDESTIVTARALRGHQWSTLNQTTYTTGPLPLRISELMYHPVEASASEIAAGYADDDDFEYIELENTSSTMSVDLTGVTLSGGIDFTFSDVELEPSQRVVVVRNEDAFRLRYGPHARIVGQYGNGDAAGQLSNSGERIRLADAFDNVIQEFTYSDEWYGESDGEGYSLVASALASAEELSTAAGWRISRLSGGSPGLSERIPGDANGDGIVNSRDLVQVFEAGEYEDDEENNSTFEEGDWNGDGDFTSRDLVLLFQLGTFQANALAVDRLFSL